jgi:mRNA interferase RelE/StbE
MQITYLKAFYKDLDKLKNQKVAYQLLGIIQMLENASSIKEIPDIKKLKGPKSAFSIRIGNYRIGLFIEGSNIELARFLPRKDIYRYFPY